MTNNTPYVGKIVHYVSYGTPGGEYQPEHRAAIITGLDDHNVVHLCVLNPGGFFFNRYVIRDEVKKRGGTWHVLEVEDER